jgi:tRNA A37 methylthiotransferase MiaB
MQHNYHREDVYRFSFEDLKQFIIDAEELEMPDYIYEELQEAIRAAQAEEHTACVTIYHGIKDGCAYCGFDNEAGGSDSLVYWLQKQAEKMEA